MKNARLWCAFITVSTAFAMPWCAAEEMTADKMIVNGRSLSQWVAGVSGDLSGQALDETVEALCSVMDSEHLMMRVKAADALALLGPKAKAAIPTLLGQLGHELPWVRVSSQAALGSMGKEAVPALIETFQANLGGPSVRAVFVLGGIGVEAKGAVPIIEEAMKTADPVMADRYLGILTQIAPEKYTGNVSMPEAHFDAESAKAQGPQLDVPTGDWPQFHGPGRNSVCHETGLLQEWPEGGPKQLWQLEGLGEGYSNVSIVGGKLFTAGDLPSDGEEEVQYVLAFDLDSRKRLWATAIGAPHKDGPRGTPTIDGDLLYAIGTGGNLVCLETATGTLLWKRNLIEDFGGAIMSGWKYSESPLVDEDKLICTPGGPVAAIAALNKLTGETIWACRLPDLGTEGADGAGYSSIVAAEIDGVRQYVQMLGRGVVGVDAETGTFLWGYNKIANTIANITAPVVRGSYVFVTTAYSTGSALLKIVPKDGGFEAKEVYFISPKDFQNHHGGVVLVGDYIYGGHGPGKGEPACIELSTGRIVWKEKAPARGSAGIIYADGQLIFRYDRGKVVMAKATPEGYTITGQFEADFGDGPAWAHPVISNGRLYLRQGDVLRCYDLQRR